MPSSNDGSTWKCDRCGLSGFTDFNDARGHELGCEHGSARKRDYATASSDDVGESARKRRRPSSSPSSQNLSYSIGNVDDGKRPNPINTTQTTVLSQSQTSSFFPLLPSEHDLRIPQNVPYLTLQTAHNVEFFRATAADVADHDGNATNGGVGVTTGQLGIRCIHCSTTPFAKAEYSSVFPATIGSIPASLNMMAQHHFMKCILVPIDTRSSIERSLHCENVGSDSDAFIEYMVSACKMMNIVNKKPAKTGIVLNEANAPSQPLENNFEVLPTPVVPKNNRHHLDMNDQVYHGNGYAPQSYSSNVSQYENDQIPHSHQKPSYQGYPMQEATPYNQSHRTPSTYHEQSFYQGGPHQDFTQPAPSMYDSPPGSLKFPYFQDSYGFWICKHCSSVPLQYRLPNAVWQSTQPPPRHFMEPHLLECNPELASSSRRMQSSPNVQHYGQSPQDPWIQQQPSRMQPSSQYPGSRYSSPQHHPHGGSNYNGYPTYDGYRQGPQDRFSYPMMNPEEGQQGRFFFPQEEMDRSQTMMPYSNHTGPLSQEQPGINTNDAIEYLTQDDNERVLKHALEEKENMELISNEDKSLLTDYFFFIMKQLRICRFSEADRKTRGGKRDSINIGYGGLQCVHCSGSHQPRKFFWSNVDRLANSFAEIPGHVLKCRRCPPKTKEALQALKLTHPDQMAQMPRGSQKVFFRRMWRRLHDQDESDGNSQISGSIPPSPQIDKIATPGRSSPQVAKSSPHKECTTLVEMPNLSESIIPLSAEEVATGLVAQSSNKVESNKQRLLLAIPEDKEWLSDLDCFIRQNLEVFCATQHDVDLAEADRKYPVSLGQVGIRCLHCSLCNKGDGARGTSVAFPYAITGIYESVREFQRIHLEQCPNQPPDQHSKLASLKGSTSLSSVLRRYYVMAAKAIGLKDSTGGIQAGAIPEPIGGETKEYSVNRGAVSNLANAIRMTEADNEAYMNSSSFSRKREYNL